MGTRYLWDPVEDNIVKELDDAGNTTANYTTEPYLYGDLISQRRAGQSSFYHYDGQGSTTSLTDSAANVTDTYAYSAFGELTARTGGTVNPFQYVGQKGYYRQEETGECDVQRRTLDPAQGRWLTSDPWRFINGPNAYLYCLSNPVNKVDPSGLIVTEAVCAIRYTGSGPGYAGGALITFLTTVPPATPATVCPVGYSFVAWRPLVGDELTVAGICAAIAASPACPTCNVIACEQKIAILISSIRATWLWNLFGRPIGPNTCERWVFDLESRLPPEFSLGDACITRANLVTFTVTGNLGSPKHAAYKITFCDGTVIYADNGALGKGDHIFFPGDIPANMTED